MFRLALTALILICFALPCSADDTDEQMATLIDRTNDALTLKGLIQLDLYATVAGNFIDAMSTSDNERQCKEWIQVYIDAAKRLQSFKCPWGNAPLKKPAQTYLKKIQAQAKKALKIKTSKTLNAISHLTMNGDIGCINPAVSLYELGKKINADLDNGTLKGKVCKRIAAYCDGECQVGKKQCGDGGIGVDGRKISGDSILSGVAVCLKRPNQYKCNYWSVPKKCAGGETCINKWNGDEPACVSGETIGRMFAGDPDPEEQKYYGCDRDEECRFCGGVCFSGICANRAGPCDKPSSVHAPQGRTH